MFAKPDAKTHYEVFYYYDEDQLQAVRSGPWKLFLPVEDCPRHPHFSKENNKVKSLLFDVENDIRSSINVAARHPKTVERLSQLAERALEDLDDLGVAGKNVRPAGHVDHPIPQRLGSGNK